MARSALQVALCCYLQSLTAAMCSVAESLIVFACHARAETLCAEAYSILSDHIRAQSRVDIHSKRVHDDLDLSLLSWGLKPVMMQACACLH